VAVDQDLDAAQPLSSIEVEGEGISVAVDDGESVSLPGALNTITISMRQDRPIGTRALRAAIARTDSGSSPSVARSLLRDARVAARRNRLRIAAIDGGSALEAALAEFNTTVVRANVGSRPTLGTYCSNAAISVAAHLPATIKVEVLDVRNDAIHSNVVPSSTNVRRLLSTVTAIVNRVDPLPET
jgi:hypothetical protein